MTQILLIIAPVLFSILILSEKFFKVTFNIVFIGFLSVISIVHFFNFDTQVGITLPHSFHTLFMILDFALLFYFFIQGFIKKSPLVYYLAAVQTLLYVIVLLMDFTIVSDDIVVDKISSVMFLVINLVGGMIIVFALEYIKDEEFSAFKKRFFISLLFMFLGVMNFIVSTNNIEIFFMLFEFTTLFSYLLIRYRGDETAVNNSLRALWMNQIGGIAILIALILAISKYDTIYFDVLLSSIDAVYLLPVVFLAFAAFVKGASIPFEKWLLGAMVAPTPVSAMLHSATMVKIAPYLILKLSVAMSGYISLTITLFGSFVFFAASLMALGKDYFKEVLGLSTIAALAMMMALAAIGSEEAINVALILIVFHAISKAMLFLQAGILEKSFHLKYLSTIDGLINHSKLITFFIIVGFASLTLPPFGLFIGKFLAIELVSKEIMNNPLYAISLVFIALGSVLFTLLYFKVVTKLFAKEEIKYKKPKIPVLYLYSSFTFLAMLFVGVIVSLGQSFLSAIQIIAPMVLIVIVPLLFAMFIFKNAHRVKEYNCGEKDEVELNMYYFNVSETTVKIFYGISIAMMIILVLGVI